jgi:hypothetical protein
MNEKPKSIWKKSWHGLGAVFILALSAAVIAFLVAFIYALTNWEKPVADTFTKAALTGSIFAACCLFAVCFVLLLRWLFWTHWRRGLFNLASLATLIALFYAEEDWRGWHAWNQFKHQWEAKGEKFGWQSVVPPPVPDDQNFAFSPVWIAEERYNFLDRPKRAEAWYGNRIYDEEVSKILPLLPVSVSGLVGKNWGNRSAPTPATSGDWRTGKLTDLKPWQAYYRGFEETNPTAEIPIAPQPQSPAADVLLALSKFDPVIEQLRQDSARPYAQFPLGYDDENQASILLPHLAVVKRYSQLLQLRAIAELQEGQADKALADVKLALRVMDLNRVEPFLISHLVRIAVLQITLQPIYEGLAEHKWSDAQLATLDAELKKLNLSADYQLAMRGEMGCQEGIIDYLRHHPEQLSNISAPGDNNPPLPGRILAHMIPSGWFYQNRLGCARMMVEFYIPLADVNQQSISPAAVQRADKALQTETRIIAPYDILERMLLPALGNAVKKFAYAQSSVDLARAAIALERYRLAHGGYPESLDALSPQFMEKVPHDVIGGGPLHYRRDPPSQSSTAAGGQFVLYSAGWNERDDGGVVVFEKGSTPGVDINQGDWVWKHPAK